MSTEEIQSIVDIALQPKQKTENRKIIVILFFGCSICTMIGIDIGGWKNWREDMTVWRAKIDAQIDVIQREKNAEATAKINNIKIK